MNAEADPGTDEAEQREWVGHLLNRRGRQTLLVEDRHLPVDQSRDDRV